MFSQAEKELRYAALRRMFAAGNLKALVLTGDTARGADRCGSRFARISNRSL